jgi:hypothetical protein
MITEDEPVYTVPERCLKVPVVSRPGEYKIMLEQAPNGMVLLHCEVENRWSKGLRKDLRDDLRRVMALRDCQLLYCLHNPKDAKHLKFIQAFGARYFSPHPDRPAVEDIYHFDIRNIPHG